jgi:hypothetical protein
MTSLRTAFRNETSDNIEYGEAMPVALQLKAQRQIEVNAPDHVPLDAGYTGRPGKAQSGAISDIGVDGISRSHVDIEGDNKFSRRDENDETDD